jgi:hypothetical protein
LASFVTVVVDSVGDEKESWNDVEIQKRQHKTIQVHKLLTGVDFFVGLEVPPAPHKSAGGNALYWQTLVLIQSI